LKEHTVDAGVEQCLNAATVMSDLQPWWLTFRCRGRIHWRQWGWSRPTWSN